MPTPEPDRFTLEEVSPRWIDLYGPLHTPGYIVRLSKAGHVELGRELNFDGPDGLSAMEQGRAISEGKATYRAQYWITREERDQFEKRHPPHQPGESLALAEHVSPNLAALNQAAVEFWLTADRDDLATHPNSQDVIKWFGEQGFSQSKAKAGASIIRPDWARKGRPPGK